MRVWIDDIRKMPAGFNVHCKSYKEAVDFLSANEVDYISFDHDLGQGKTGYDIACWIEQNAYKGAIKQMEWGIHSANPVGARNIKMAMKGAERFWKHIA